VEALDGVLETVEYGVRRSSRVEPFETASLDVLDERWGRTLACFDASDLELVFPGDLSKVLRQRAGVAVALWEDLAPDQADEAVIGKEDFRKAMQEEQDDGLRNREVQ